MKNIVKKVFTVISLVSIAAGVNACGNANLPAANQLVQAPQYTAFTREVENQQNSQLLVKFKKGTSKNGVNEFHAKYGTRTIKVLPAINVHVIETTVGIKSSQLIRYFNNDPLVQYAEINTEISLDTDTIINPVYTIQSVDYERMLNQQISVSGTYYSSRSGAIIETNKGRLSIVDIDGTVLTELPNLSNGSRLALSGIVKRTKGFNSTNDLGIMPVSIKIAR